MDNLILILAKLSRGEATRKMCDRGWRLRCQVNNDDALDLLLLLYPRQTLHMLLQGTLGPVVTRLRANIPGNTRRWLVSGS